MLTFHWASSVVRAASSIVNAKALQLFVVLVASAAILPVAYADAEPAKLSTPEVHERLLLESKKLLDAGRFARAAKTLGPVCDDELWGDVARILVARCYVKLKQPEKAQAIVEEFAAKHRESAFAPMAQEILVHSLCDQGSLKAREPLLKMIAKAPPKDRPVLIEKAARLEERLGDFTRAASHYRRLFVRYPASVEGLAAEKGLADLVRGKKVPAVTYAQSELLERASRLSQKGRADLAAKVYSEVLSKSPHDVKLNLKLAQCRFKARENTTAIELLKKLLEQKLGDDERAEALYLLSRLYWRVDGEKEFLDACHKIVETGPADFRKKALFSLGAQRMEQGALEQAQEYLERLLKLEPSRSTTVDVLWKLAWVKYFRKEYAQAAETFGKARSKAGGGQITIPSQYWQAASLIRANKPKDAELLLKSVVKAAPFDYYGLLAARLMQSNGWSGSDENISSRTFPDLALSQAQKQNRHIAAALRLMDKGLYEFAQAHMDALPSTLKSAAPVAYLAARAAYGAGDHSLAYKTLVRRFPNLVSNLPPDAPDEFRDMAFPRVHAGQTVREAKKRRVDPNLVWAVIRQESCYDPSAVSPAGALGLMQVTPEASGLSSGKERPAPKVIERLLTPKDNLDCGIRILAANLREFKGKLAPAIASYNADIRKVQQWQKQRGHLDQAEFIETIPYLETRMYVKKVLAGYDAYSRIHSKKSLANLW
ncbi:MAG: transglycosylase SLT domain-containing protein [Thermodesulfobacteriota bacterium]